jgi:hypothetical protein
MIKKISKEKLTEIEKEILKRKQDSKVQMANLTHGADDMKTAIKLVGDGKYCLVARKGAEAFLAIVSVCVLLPVAFVFLYRTQAKKKIETHNDDLSNAELTLTRAFRR